MADSWFQGWFRFRGLGVRWIDFGEELCRRFGEKNMADVIQEFNKLKQEGAVIEYLEKFEELGVSMWNAQPTLTEQYFVSSFISGLKD